MTTQTTDGGDWFTRQYGRPEIDYEEALKKSDLVFVYGTLKSNEKYGSHHILKDCEFLGEDVTLDSFVMGNVGFPYVFPKEVVPEEHEDHLFPVSGQVWRIKDDLVFRKLDSLEGYPNHYTRQVVLTQGDHLAWMYLQEDWSSINSCYYCTLTEDNTWQWP